MQLYLFVRSNYIDYGEYIGGVVAALNPARAMEIMNDLCFEDEQWECTLIAKIAESQIKEGIVLESSNNE